MAVAFRPDGNEVAVATLNTQISFWDVDSATQTASVEGRHDLGYTRKDTDKITAKKSSYGKWVKQKKYSSVLFCSGFGFEVLWMWFETTCCCWNSGNFNPSILSVFRNQPTVMQCLGCKSFETDTKVLQHRRCFTHNQIYFFKSLASCLVLKYAASVS